MTCSFARIVLPVALLTMGLVRTSPGQEAPRSAIPPGRSDVVDEAGLFGKEAVEEARLALRNAEGETRVPVLVRVVESLRGAPIEEAAIAAARSTTGQGVLLFISKQEKKLYILVRRPFQERLPRERQESVRDTMLASFKAGEVDAGLRKGVEEIVATLKQTAPAAEAEGLVVRDRVGLSLAGARKVLEAAEARAAERGWKMNIAVVDDGGHLLAFARMDGARPASATTAQTKAISASTFRQATGPLPVGTSAPDLLLNLSVPAAAASGGGRITPLLGGLPIEVDGQVIGAIGVGGGSGEQDAEVARSGVAALIEAISTPAPK